MLAFQIVSQFNKLPSSSSSLLRTSLRFISREALVRQVICVIIQNRCFDGELAKKFLHIWTGDIVCEILRAVPRFFFQSMRSIGCQKGFRRRAPLKQRNSKLEAEYPVKGLQLRGPACYRDPTKVASGIAKALEFYSWVEQCGFIHNEITCKEMACVLAKGNELKKLWHFLREMARKDFRLVTCTSLTCVIKILGEEGYVKEALSIFYRMKQFHCKPDLISYNTIIAALCRVGHFKKARSFLNKMELPGFRCPPDTYTYTILIGFYCKYSFQTGCGKAIRRRIWEANHLFRHMLFKGFSPDVVTYNCLIDGLCKTYRIERACELFNDMLIRGCFPNRVTYNSFIRYYSAVNEVDKAVEMLENMRLSNHGMPTSSTYTPIIHSLCEVKWLNEARAFLIKMVEEGSIPREYTYKLVCDALRSAGLSGLPDEVCQRIEDGIRIRCKQVMLAKPMMV